VKKDIDSHLTHLSLIKHLLHLTLLTEECLEIIRVDSDRNLLLVKGAIPGSKSGFVKVRLSAKKDKVNAGISKQLQEQKEAENVVSTEDNTAEETKAKE
jgi:large subunit ribosomal protein L3